MIKDPMPFSFFMPFPGMPMLLVFMKEMINLVGGTI